MKNWAGNLQYAAAAIHFPRSVDEVCHLVRQCDKVRALGTRHSFNAIADCPGKDLISLKHLDRIVRFDQLGASGATVATVTVEGGITYGQLCPQLDREGVALHNLASLPHISVAGACATATHGSGDRNGNLATAVVAMKVVDAAGVERELSTKTEGFAGMVVGLGAFGPVTELTLKLEPRYAIRQEVYLNLPMGQLAAHFDEITSTAYSVSLFTDWRGPKFNQVWLKHRAGDGEPAAWHGEFFEAMPASARMHPLAGLSAENCTEQLAIRGPWHDRLPHFRMDFTPSNGVELQTEYLVPRERAPEAIDRLYAMRGDIAPILQVSEIRTIATDDLWMSPCYRQPCVGIHFTWERNTPAVEAILPRIQDRLRDLGARPHWGKLFALNGVDWHGLYGERLARFRSLMTERDPTGKFRNDFLEKTILAAGSIS